MIRSASSARAKTCSLRSATCKVEPTIAAALAGDAGRENRNGTHSSKVRSPSEAWWRKDPSSGYSCPSRIMHPVSTGFTARARNPLLRAILTSPAATTVLPTPVSVPVTKIPFALRIIDIGGRSGYWSLQIKSPVLFSANLSNASSSNRNQVHNFIGRYRQGGHQYYYIAKRPQNQTVIANMLSDLGAQPFFQEDTLSGDCDLPRVYPDHETTLPHVAYVTQVADFLRKPLLQKRYLQLRCLQNSICFEYVKTSARRSACQTVPCITVAVEERLIFSVFSQKSCVNFIGDHCSGNGEISTGESFCQSYHVRTNTFMFTCEHFAGSAEAGGNFITN